MENTSSLQQALATLITHPELTESYTSYRKELISKLNLSEYDMQKLDSFYTNEKNKFIASSKILKKNRWEGIQSSLPVSALHLNESIFNEIWESYLYSYQIIDHPPKNPLIESILFSKYAEKSGLLSKLEREIIKYERIRNEVVQLHHEDFTDYSIQPAECVNEDNMQFLSIYIHACYRVYEFTYDISRILSENYSKRDFLSQEQQCLVLFFKNLKKEGIGTLKISTDIKNILENVVNAQDLLKAYSLIDGKIKKELYLQFLLNLQKIGVLVIINKEEEE